MKKKYVISIQKSKKSIAVETTSEESLISSGMAIARSLSEVKDFDSSLREEIFGSATSTVSDDGIFLPPFCSTTNPSADNVRELIENVIRLPEMVRSSTLQSFLTAFKQQEKLNDDDDDEEEEEEKTLQYIQYLLPSFVQQHSQHFEVLPRIGSIQREIDIIGGWWIVWAVRIPSPAIVDLTIFSEIESGQRQTIQQMELEFPTDKSYHFGSYRCVDNSNKENETKAPSLKAIFQLKGRSLIWTGPDVSFDFAVVPHEAFVAACAAATDQTEASTRKKRAPMLNLLLTSPETAVTVREQHDGGQLHPEKEDESTDCPVRSGSVASSNSPTEIDQLRKKVEILEKAQIKAGLLMEENEQLHQRAASMESERRVWTVARNGIQEQISRLSEELTLSRKEKAALQTQLQETQREVRELRGQVKFFELQAPNDDDDQRLKALVNGAQSKAIDMNKEALRLRAELLSQKQEKDETKRELEAVMSKLSRTQNEAQELRIKHRVLEGQLRQLQQESSSRKNLNRRSTPVKMRRHKLSKEIMAFKHPDSTTNQQLDILKDRHEKIRALLIQNPNNVKNLEILGKLEKTILGIVGT